MTVSTILFKDQFNLMAYKQNRKTGRRNVQPTNVEPKQCRAYKRWAFTRTNVEVLYKRRAYNRRAYKRRTFKCRAYLHC